MNKIENTKGITLIALVIIIIILLILSAITISALTGDNGLFARVKQAKIDTQRASAEEQVKIAVSRKL